MLSDCPRPSEWTFFAVIRAERAESRDLLPERRPIRA
jgi:hypothetical protein